MRLFVISVNAEGMDLKDVHHQNLKLQATLQSLFKLICFGQGIFCIKHSPKTSCHYILKIQANQHRHYGTNKISTPINARIAKRHCVDSHQVLF